jgi:hypothetical protein
MKTALGVLSASTAMLTEKPLVQVVFYLLTFYLIYLEFKSNKQMPE